MANKDKSAAAYVIAMDLRGFSKLSQSDYNKVVENIYGEIARILKQSQKSLIDKKTVGDGFIFYFDSASESIDCAFKIRDLFKGDYIHRLVSFQKKLSCRIALHSGQFFWFTDQIEERKALFGRNIITVARLEPVVRDNEIWCTRGFKDACELSDVANKYQFQDLGICELAKGWKEQEVYALYDTDTDSKPAKLSSDKPVKIKHNNTASDKFKHTYFVLIRLKDRNVGVAFFKKHLESQNLLIEAVYYLFGNFDVLMRFKTSEKFTEGQFAEILSEERISRKGEKCRLTEIHFSGSASQEPIMVFPKNNHRYLKAFTYIKSDTIVADPNLTKRILNFAIRSCGDSGVVTHYTNKSHLILPIVIPVEKYYALAEAIEAIEAFVDSKNSKEWDDDHVTITTYPVQGFEEFYETNKA